MAQRLSVIALAVAMIAASGCFLTHGTDDPPPRVDPPPVVDPPTIPPPTIHPPTMPPPTGPTCAITNGQVTVELIDIDPPEHGGCLRGDGWVEGNFVDAEARPEIDGVRIVLDGCPAAETSCLCGIDVSGVGTDVATQISLNTNQYVAGSFDFNHVTLQRDFGCDGCVGCVCPRPWILFHAEDSEPGRYPAPLVVSQGESTCFVEHEDLWFARSLLDLSLSLDDEPLLSVDEGETGRVLTTEEDRSTVLVLRNLRSNVVTSPFTDDDFDEPFHAAYALWEEPVFLPGDGSELEP